MHDRNQNAAESRPQIALVPAIESCWPQDDMRQPGKPRLEPPQRRHPRLRQDRLQPLVLFGVSFRTPAAFKIFRLS
jgi:hypothetical protein